MATSPSNTSPGYMTDEVMTKFIGPYHAGENRRELEVRFQVQLCGDVSLLSGLLNALDALIELVTCDSSVRPRN
jgi:hypothetical protein